MINEQFMLHSPTAINLYEQYAKTAPIYDYHCHLSAQQIDEDAPFTNIHAIWLQYDHYKWRALRYAGVPEKYITGDGDALTKFKYWAKTAGRLIGSPLYHWANMELKTYFGIHDILNEHNATEIYNLCNSRIAEAQLSPIKMIEQSNVKLICTTDDPIDSLIYHQNIAQKGYDFQVLPTFRPDKAFQIHQPTYLDYLSQLGKVAQVSITSYTTLMEALCIRIDYFHDKGCRLSDHSLESLMATTQSEREVSTIFDKVLNGQTISIEEFEKFKNQSLIHLSAAYAAHNWVMQLHIGAMRNNNPQMFEKLGPDAGYDTMNDFDVALPLKSLLSQMHTQNALPKTILYTLNSKDNLVLATLPHCFSEDNVPGKIQFGAAWWFNDHKEGFLSHFQALANQGMLADFVGMLTDSRSFLSYVRHDYFRRILCNYLGDLVESGEFSNDPVILAEIVEGICYKNIIQYLNI